MINSAQRFVQGATKPGIYITFIETINDPDLKGVTQNHRMQTAPSTASGPLSIGSDEDLGPDPNATHVQVDIEQKRAL